MEQYDSVQLIDEFKGLPLFTKGCIVEVFNHGEAFMVEFFDEENNTLGVESIKSEQIELRND